MITAKATTRIVDPFTFQRRKSGGGTAPLRDWGFKNETDPLTDVLLNRGDHFQAVPLPVRNSSRSASTPKG